LRASVALLPSSLLWGASFSLALAAAGTRRGDAARLTGQLYAANTLGAIVGSLIAATLLVPVVGTQRTQQAIALVSGLAAAIAIYAHGRGSAPARHAEVRPKTTSSRPGPTASMLAVAGMLVAALLAVTQIKPPPHGFLAAAPYPSSWTNALVYRYAREGRHAPVVVQEHLPTKSLSLWISGKVVATTVPNDMRTQRMLGHLPALVHGSPQRTLTVGLGTGMTAGCFVVYPEVEEIQICEIEPAVVDAARMWFAQQNHDVVDDPRSRVVIDDARHYLATVGGRFDVITSDPIHPWVRGAAALYSTEYYDLCKQHLNPGGVVAQWIPLFDADLATAKCQLATFVDAFPHTMFWTGWRRGDTAVPLYDLIAIGSLEPIVMDLTALDRKINDSPRLKADLDEVGIGTIGGLFSQYAGSGEDFGPLLADAQINSEVSLRLEYLAGVWMWLNVSDQIMAEIAPYVRYPGRHLNNAGEFEGEIRSKLGLGSPEP
jgi:spermidine synthase